MQVDLENIVEQIREARRMLTDGVISDDVSIESLSEWADELADAVSSSYGDRHPRRDHWDEYVLDRIDIVARLASGVVKHGATETERSIAQIIAVDWLVDTLTRQQAALREQVLREIADREDRSSTV